MYEQFGASVDPATGAVTFQLFIPNNTQKAPESEGTGIPHISRVSVVGTFQEPRSQQWDTSHALPLEESPYLDSATGHAIGTLYSLTVNDLSDGFYEYKYWVEFEKADSRLLTDPCSRYGGSEHQNSAFVVGEQVERVEPLAARLPLQDLVIYELMIDDFTANIRQGDEAPLQTVVRKLDELQDLGINAIGFMPWMAWSNNSQAGEGEISDFSWGYNPVQFFAAAHKYTNNASRPTEKLVYLKHLIDECHRRGIHVIMDAVFNHADGNTPGKGFPYYWLYRNPDDSPFVGEFEKNDFFEDLDYANQCTLEYIRDACFYWIDNFGIDGIRFDHTEGYYRADDPSVGLTRLLCELRVHLEEEGQENFSLILEHSWDYEAIEVVNHIEATSCWLDPYRSKFMKYLGKQAEGGPQIEPGIMRLLDAAHNFEAGRTPVIYIENHDHRRFMCVAGGRKNWYLTQPYVIALFTSPGATLMYNGQEWGLDNDMPDEGDGRVVPRPLDWEAREHGEGPKLVELYRQLIKLRHEHPALRTSNFYPSGWDEKHTQFNAEGFGVDRERNLVVFHRWGTDAEGNRERLYVVLNFSGKTQHVSFEVPEVGPWTELLSGTSARAKAGRLEVEVGSNWGAIYHRSG